jgi:hypothetical protein
VDARYLTHLEGFPRSVQRAIFEADGHRCRRCKATENLEADHIAPTHHGGQSAGENGRTLCHEWHRRKTYCEEWIKPRSANNLLDPLQSARTIEALFYVDPRDMERDQEAMGALRAVSHLRGGVGAGGEQVAINRP